MGDISFDTLYQKSLLIKRTDIVEEVVKYKLSQEQQIEYLKKLGELKFEKEDCLIHRYDKELSDFKLVLYMVKVPKIKDSVDTDISLYLEYDYRTAILLINENENGYSTIDNILAFQNENIELVEEKYNSLYKQVSEQSDEEIINIINDYIDNEISKN